MNGSWVRRFYRLNPVHEVQFISEIKVTQIQGMGGDDAIVGAMLVSTTGQAVLGLTDEKANFGRINYLMKHRHGTPFEHSSLTMFVHAPVAVWWEWVRHRIGHSFNLESGRYSVLKPVFWIPRRSRKMVPAPGHKSAKPKFQEADDRVYWKTVRTMKRLAKVQWAAYRVLLALGVANEVSRSVLGFSIYYSGWVTVNPRSLMAFISLRTHDPDAAYPSYPASEIEEAARQAERLLELGWPLTYRAFIQNGRVAP
jgi:thymidylate synthase (FAD)